MLKLVGSLDKGFYRPRCYVSATTDAMGTQKALTAEQQVRGAAADRTLHHEMSVW